MTERLYLGRHEMQERVFSEEERDKAVQEFINKICLAENIKSVDKNLETLRKLLEEIKASKISACNAQANVL